MMYAKKIKMEQWSTAPYYPRDIAEVYVDGCDNPGFYPKATLHNYLKDHPHSIKVDIAPYPYIVPATSVNGEKYVRSEPNDTTNDNLLKLPRV